ncbi:DUF2812 domain-containing protein [Paucisalibacillus globulus]|uniref:DUF2812 domain-containing protein n=1 Tax=Paucisalibacillus globulus TaxID=351095 RepID=UPI0003FBE43C|nr:DUF2812 domain-containing protein [Paucisalibacillus globulus]
MTVKKFKLFLAPDVEKEEQWLNEMSRQGLHLIKYQYFMYVFEEDPGKSYVYQIDFRQDAKKDYFQLYEDAGWEYMTNALSSFYYFRTNATKSTIPKLYSDKESIHDSYRRMFGFYWLIFILFLVSQVGVFITWKGYLLQYMMVVVDIVIVALYLYMFYAFNKRINFYRRR